MPTNSTGTGVKPGWRKWQWPLFLAVMVAALSVVCREGFKPYNVMWSNDTALGAAKSAQAQLPSAFTGAWLDGNWIGIENPANTPTVSSILGTILSVEWFQKVYAPFSSLLLGFAAWVLFRQLKFAPMVCILGGLAAGLNMHGFSNATWGLGTWNIAIAMDFFAVAALVTDAIRQWWIKAALAGLAVGMAVMEGFDSGAILSVFAGVFALYYCWITESTVVAKVTHGLRLGLVMVVCAFLIAASTLSTLVTTSVRGIAGMGQTAQEKQDRWYGATIWSLPKIETLRIIIPGLFGYRLINYDTTTDKAGVYWGKVGESPEITALNSSDPEVRLREARASGLAPEEIKVLQGDDLEAREVVVNNVAERNPNWQRRHTGSGEFSGVLVTLLAIFGLANTARRKGMPYSTNERRMVWFWGLAALVSMMAAWGRYSFVYALLYKIPYVSTIRNPIKFLHPFNLCWIILAGFGAEALYRNYLRRIEPVADAVAKPEKSTGVSKEATRPERTAKSEKSTGGNRENREERRAVPTATPAKPEAAPLSGFDLGWICGLVALAVGVGVVFWIYGGSHTNLARQTMQRLTDYIAHQDFGEVWASRIAPFAMAEIGKFVLFFALSAGAVAVIMTGVLRGKRALWAGVALCLIMFCDLCRADRPWVRYYNYQEKYAMNPIVDFLRHEPYEHRVAAKIPPNGGYSLEPREFAKLGEVCHWWLENDFPYNDIQAMDFDQLSRPPVMENNYMSAFPITMSGGAPDFTGPVRLWKLCNSRYLLCPAAVVPYLNAHGDPVQQGFQIRARFNLEPKPWVTNEPEDSGDYTAVMTNNGIYALAELTNALPRAKLYANWQVPADDASTLQLLSSDLFDPAKAVLVAHDTNSPVPAATAPDADPGTVHIVDYKPKAVRLQASVKTNAVLLLNDRIADAWHAWVDDKPVTTLRCNYIMRGVYLTPGEHTIDFRYQPPQGYLYVTLAALLFGIALGGYLVYSHFAGGPAESKHPVGP